MFGLKGRSFFGNVMGHYFVHFQKKPERVGKIVSLNETFEVVEKSGVDVVGICEIYEGQENEIIFGLEKLGYRYFYFGRGHRFKYNDRHVVELIASKIEGEQLDYRIWPIENRLGGGGGFVVVRFGGFSIMHVHLGLPTRGMFKKQIEYMQKIISELKGKVIVMGDFNYSWCDLSEYFLSFDLASGGVKTCSLTPIMRWLYNKDVDHVFCRGFGVGKFGTFESRSDHKLVYADLNYVGDRI